MRSASPTDFASWRDAARALLSQAVPPEEVEWNAAASLFADEPLPGTRAATRLPRRLVELLERAACHRDPGRWALMYRVVFRMVHGAARDLLADAADADVARLLLLAKAVDREVHHMHAFVRFRETRDASGEPLYAAWFEPEHPVLRLAAPFFRDRFASMRWIIATPEGSASWDLESLRFDDTPRSAPEGADDEVEPLWLAYYASVNNAARPNARAMKQHMPLRYWRNLPEAAQIAKLSAQPPAPPQAAVAPRWAGGVQVELAPAGELQECRRCGLWEHATQAVPGAGAEGARLMLVGEQPGDEEDLRGEPFVGPAGQVLDRALREAGIDRAAVYVTNAVKHFKWEPRGKRRLHKTPAQQEIEACHVWLEREIGSQRPAVIVALGGTAAFALLGRKVPIAASRGQVFAHASGARVIVTYHPSAILRAQEGGEALFETLREDLLRVFELQSSSRPRTS